jgi:hypothetical protein
VYLAEFAGESGLAVAEVLIDPVHADTAVHAGVTLTVVQVLVTIPACKLQCKHIHFKDIF